MVKFRWLSSKIAMQRMMLLTMIGVISYGIYKGHQDYEKEVSEYMNSLEYRRAREASQDYHVQKMKTNQRLFNSDEPPSPPPPPPVNDKD